MSDKDRHHASAREGLDEVLQILIEARTMLHGIRSSSSGGGAELEQLDKLLAQAEGEVANQQRRRCFDWRTICEILSLIKALVELLKSWLSS